jgi:uncharacterized lipoprotein YddW (UPF0748 family)
VKRLLAFFSLATLTLGAEQYRAFWADAFHPGYKTPEEVDRMVEDLALARANAIFIEVRRRGDSYYLKSLEPPAEDPAYSPGFDALEYLIERAHARGIEVHAWFPVAPLWPSSSPPIDPRHAWHAHGPHAPGGDMWMTVSAQGKKSGSVDPGNPGAMRYLADVILEPLKHYDLDGIHLDYIRYPEDDDYGWNPAAIARFQRLYNRPGVPAPRDPRWSDFRRRQVTQLVRQIYLRAAAIKPKAIVSAAVITWGDAPAGDAAFANSSAYARVFQDWRSWLQEGILDLSIPMNYFRETQYPQYLNRWLEFEKDRQYNRGLVVGLGIYLNSIPDSLRQITRALAPSSAGNKALGVCLFSYASTNILNAAGAPAVPNAEFYRAIGEWFEVPAKPPVLPWKSEPSAGHIYGALTVDDGPAYLTDGATVRVESDTGKITAVETTTDGTGFFGVVGLPPDRYRVSVLRGGELLYRAAPKDVRSGEATRFDLVLKAEHFLPATPAITGADKPAAAPGDLLALTGTAFAEAYASAAGVPLPLDLGRTQVLVNGNAAALFSIDATRIELQLPFEKPAVWEILVRRDGLDSQVWRLPAAPAAPVILGALRSGRLLSLWAAGLGALDPPLPVGAAADPAYPLPRVLAPVSVLASTAEGEVELTPSYAGAAPWLPARYQVNVELPAGGPLTVRLKVAGAVSAPFRVE